MWPPIQVTSETPLTSPPIAGLALVEGRPSITVERVPSSSTREIRGVAPGVGADRRRHLSAGPTVDRVPPSQPSAT
jgi:hypothetical protein